MIYLNSLIILKENKKPSGKYLRVWAKIQLRFGAFDNAFKYTCENLNGKLMFYPFSLPPSRSCVIFYYS